MLGGNGITHENYVMKALADAEAIYTYEGTYDINTLVAGRELTGLSAFKWMIYEQMIDSNEFIDKIFFIEKYLMNK